MSQGEKKCMFCDMRNHLHGIENGNKTVWQLSYDCGYPTLRVGIDNHHLGITLSSELMIRNCPVCGRELQ